MAKLNAARRKKIPGEEFGLPGQRKYPMPDKSHAANAKSRASEMYHKGRLTASQYADIIDKADQKLGEPKGKKGKHG